MKTDELLARLRRHVCKDGANGLGFAFLTNVRNATGYGANEGYCDALSMDLWPSRGLLLAGYELKVSRSDWLRELKAPHKADTFHRYCDKWFLVVGDKEIVHDGELPEPWGLIGPRGGGLGILKPAPVNEVRAEIGRPFLAALLRAAIGEQLSAKQLAAARDEAREDEKGRSAATVEALTRDVKDRDEIIAAFERQSGVRLPLWNGGKDADAIGAALRSVLDGDRDIGQIHRRLGQIASDLDVLLQKHRIEKAPPLRSAA